MAAKYTCVGRDLSLRRITPRYSLVVNTKYALVRLARYTSYVLCAGGAYADVKAIGLHPKTRARGEASGCNGQLVLRQKGHAQPPACSGRSWTRVDSKAETASRVCAPFWGDIRWSPVDVSGTLMSPTSSPTATRLMEVSVAFQLSIAVRGNGFGPCREGPIYGHF
jgi:hypothetical protein